MSGRNQNDDGIGSFASQLFPGLFDGLALLLIIDCCVLFCLPSLMAYGDANDDAWLWNQIWLGVFLGLHLVFISTIGMWQVFGLGPLRFRILVGALFGILPSIFLFAGFGQISEFELTSFQQVQFAVGLRLIVLSAFGVLGFFMHVFCRSRVVLGAFTNTNKIASSSINTKDCVVLFGLIAMATLHSKYIWISFLRDFTGNDPGVVCFLVAFEIVPFVIFLLLPFLVARSIRPLRRWTIFVFIVWLVLCGGGVLSFLNRRQMDGLAIYFALFLSYGIGQLLAWMVFEQCGFQFTHIASRSTHPKPTAIVRCRPVGIANVVILLGCISWLIWALDLRTFIESPTTQKLEWAGRIRALERIGKPRQNGEVSFIDSGGSFLWRDNTRCVEIQPASTDDWEGINLTLENVSPKTIEAAIYSARTAIDLTLKSNELSEDHFRATRNLRKIQSLTLVAENISELGFDRFCATTEINHLFLNISKLSNSHLQSLHKISGLASVHLHSPLAFPASRKEWLDDLPVRSLNLKIPTSAQFDLRGVSSRHLTITDSLMNEAMVLEIASVPNLDDVVFDNCRFEENVFSAMADWNFRTLEIRAKRLSERDFEKILALSTSNISDLRIDCPDLTEIFAARLNRRAGRYFLTRSHLLEIDEDWLVHTIHAKGNLNDALKLVAHEVHRNQDGEIIELDFQEMKITAEGIGYISNLDNLRRLRIAHEMQNRKLWEAVAGFHQLEVLEIPTHWISDVDLQIIAQMNSLKKLQLPLMDFAPRSRFHPDHEDFSLKTISQTADWYTSVLFDGYFKSDSYFYAQSLGHKFSFVGIAHLRLLTNLEHLIFPGLLLRDGSIPAIASMQKLKTLHAPISNLSGVELKVLLSQIQLEQLTVGISEIDESVYESFGTQGRLRRLQMCVFNDWMRKDIQVQKEMKQRMEQILPSAEINIEFAESLPK